MRLSILTSNHLRHKFLINKLAEHFDVGCVVMEEKKHDFWKVGEGTEYEKLVVKYFNDRSASEESFFGCNNELSPNIENIYRVDKGDINNLDLIRKIKNSNTDYVIVFGTSIIKSDLINIWPDKRMINIHLGLSPYYRGSGTNFWPLYEGKPEYVGATIHWLDEGIDTGEIIRQCVPDIDSSDTPHSIGNKTIQKAVDTVINILLDIKDGRKIDSIKEDKSKGNLYLFKNFEGRHIQELIQKWDKIISDYLDNKDERKVKIIE